MRKVILTICAVATLCVCGSCCGKCDQKGEGHEGEQPAVCEHHPDGPGCCKLSEEERAAFEEMMAKWEKFDELSAEEQAALVAQRRAHVEKRMAECEARRAEEEAKCAEIKAKWEKFDSLSLAEQKALIEEVDRPCGHKGGPKAPCCEKKCGHEHEGEHPCCHHEAK